MPQVRRPPIPAVVFFFFIVWLFIPGDEIPGQDLLLSEVAEYRLARYHDALDVLNQTRWGDFTPRIGSEPDAGVGHGFLNLTGFRGDKDGFIWEDLDFFRERSSALSHYAVPPIDGQQLWDVAAGEAMWTNVSGIVQGDWVRKPGSMTKTYDEYNLTDSAPGLEWMGDKADWARNITGNSGNILLRVDGNKTIEVYEQLAVDDAPLGGGMIRNIKGTATIEDTTGSGHVWEMRLWGVHWPRQGVIILTTTSEKFEGIFGLPHLTPSADFFQSSQRLLNSTLAGVVARKEENVLLDPNMPWNSDIDNPMYSQYPYPHCEFIVYAQVHPPLPQSPDLSHIESERIINAIESELEHPLGAPIEKVPRLRMSTVIYSPDCGFFLESKGPPEYPPGQTQHLVGLLDDVHVHHIKTWLLMFALVVSGQVFLLKDQMKETFTPSTMGRVSFWTTSIMVVVDGMTFLAAATWVSEAASTFLPTLALMFSAFLSMTIGGSFLGKIHEVQLPESRNRRAAERTSGNTNNTNTPSAESGNATPEPGASLLPGPVTAQRSTQSVSLPRDQSGDASSAANGASAVPGVAQTGIEEPPPQTPRQAFQDIIVRYIFTGLCLSALAVSSTTWYPALRSIFFNFCAFCYLSLWIPQIHRNVIRNCRRALRWRFVVGQSLLRLLPIAYFWVYKGNFLFAAIDRRAFAALSGWLWIQLFVLAAQDVVGPRFGVPTGWAPEAWDYHPVLKEDNIEAGGLPIGLVADDNPGLDRSRESSEDPDKRRSSARVIDCAICREVLEVPVINAGDETTSVANAFARRMYMVTPCRHIFHTDCLEGWMKFRLQCPICREELPPL
ncbi:putative RING finger ubiquitin ligase [Sarocladium strictum]